MKTNLHSRADRRALCVLVTVILLIVAAAWIVGRLKENNAPTTGPATAQQDIADFEAQLREDSAAWVREHPQWEKEQRAVETFAFDPNTADSVTFLRLGLKPWQAHNALRYRAKGGRWRNPDDFKRLYGLSEADFRRLRPYIHIAASAEQREWEAQHKKWEKDKAERQAAREARQARYDSLRATYPQKYAEGTTIDLNTADTTALKGIPGIGSVYARMICQYRERLGGFINKNQLKEINNLPDGIEKWFTLSTNQPTRKINVNNASFKELVNHPYLNYEQTKEIANYIRLHGPLHSWKELRFSKQFSEKDFVRLAPYFTF